MTEIIVYRNPAEAALWQMLSGGDIWVDYHLKKKA